MTTEVGEAKQELERLRVQVEALEAELIEVQAWATEAVEDAKNRTYWLDRWNIDLNAVMRRRSAERVRAIARVARGVYRAVRRLKSESPS
jgi:hypothetical protein